MIKRLCKFIEEVFLSAFSLFTAFSVTVVFFSLGYYVGNQDKKAQNILKRKHYIQEEILEQKYEDKKFGYYIVSHGDSIERIARKHFVRKWQLREANGFERGVIIHPGQKIKVPRIDWSKKSYVGKASWYGPKFHGKKMANGKIFDQDKLLVAHRTLPLGLKVRITNLENGKSAVVRVLDRGPYTKKYGKYDREVDASRGLAEYLDFLNEGITTVSIEPI